MNTMATKVACQNFWKFLELNKMQVNGNKMSNTIQSRFHFRFKRYYVNFMPDYNVYGQK